MQKRIEQAVAQAASAAQMEALLNHQLASQVFLALLGSVLRDVESGRTTAPINATQLARNARSIVLRFAAEMKSPTTEDADSGIDLGKEY